MRVENEGNRRERVKSETKGKNTISNRKRQKETKIDDRENEPDERRMKKNFARIGQ